MPTVALQGLRKLELTQQQVARIDNFRYHRKQRRSSRLDCLLRRKLQAFREERKAEAFWNYCSNLQSNRPLLDPFTKNIPRLATCC